MIGFIALLFVLIALVMWVCVAVGSRHDMPKPPEPKAHEKKELPYKTITNADVIRSKTDEELAWFIAGQRGWYCDFKDPAEDEYPKVLKWLKEVYK